MASTFNQDLGFLLGACNRDPEEYQIAPAARMILVPANTRDDLVIMLQDALWAYYDAAIEAHYSSDITAPERVKLSINGYDIYGYSDEVTSQEEAEVLHDRYVAFRTEEQQT